MITKGPWIVSGRNKLYITPIGLECLCHDFGQSGNDISVGSQVYTQRTLKEAQSNAQAISAVPELISALQRLLGQYDIVSPRYARNVEAVQQAKDALEKAGIK
jgi:hypothetical protein